MIDFSGRQGDSSSQGNFHSSSDTASDATDRARHQQARMQLENRLRVKKLEVNDREHKRADIERELTHLEGELLHVDQDIHRTQGELSQLETKIITQTRESKLAEGGIREQDMELHRRSDEEVKLEREIEHLRQEINEKEQRVRAMKEESRDFMRDKEALRQKKEIGQFSASNETTHAHDKGLQLQRFRQELLRKQNEIKRKKDDLERLKQDIRMKVQEVSEIEADLRKG